MKIKHFAGYGSVNARKTAVSSLGNTKTVTIEVTGNHEWGLVRNDKYDVHNWIGRRFSLIEDYRRLEDMQIASDYIKAGGLDTERATYTLTYRVF